MPAVAIIGAIAIDAIAVGALASGTLTAFTAIAAVGATVGAIGVVARDKNLQMAGMVLGAVGAIGGLASAAGLISNPTLFASSAAGSAAAGSAASGAGAVTTIDEALSPDFINSIVTPGSFGPEAGGLLGAAAPVQTNALPGAVPSDVTASGANAASATDIINTPTLPVSQDTSATGLINNAATTPTTAFPTPSASDVLYKGAAAPDVISASGNVLSGPNQGALQGMMKFAKDNPMVAYGLMQTGGSMLEGLFSPVAPAQVEALKAQAANNRAAASLTQAQVANMGGPLPTATRRPVSAANVTGVPAGIINAGAPQTVTGRIA